MQLLCPISESWPVADGLGGSSFSVSFSSKSLYSRETEGRMTISASISIYASLDNADLMVWDSASKFSFDTPKSFFEI